MNSSRVQQENLSLLHDRLPDGNLRSRLLLSRSRLDEWVEEQKAHADAAVAQANATVAERQDAIDQAMTRLLAVQLEGGLAFNGGNTSSESEARGQVQTLRTDIEAVKEQLEQCKKRNQELKLDQVHLEQTAAQARSTKEQVQAAKQTTVEDLSRTIMNYKYLGLDFEKAENESLRFSFTQMDPHDPDRAFSFVLQADAYWEVKECDPPLPKTVLDQLQENFNQSDDLMVFVRAIRNTFIQQYCTSSGC